MNERRMKVSRFWKNDDKCEKMKKEVKCNLKLSEMENSKTCLWVNEKEKINLITKLSVL